MIRRHLYYVHGALKDQGINVKPVDALNPENVRAAITDKTRFVFVETIGNPALDVVDIAAIAKIAHEKIFLWLLTLHSHRRAITDRRWGRYCNSFSE